jgi:carbon-monoxide dehydrogenase medium subunit
VDVKRLGELRGLARTDGGFAIGSATTLDTLASWSEPAPSAVIDGARLVGAVQTRTRATIGGNVCRSSPAGDMLCGLLVHEAEAELASLGGSRRVPLADFFLGPGRNVRRSDELLTRLHVPRLAGGSAYARFTYRRWMDLAVVGVAARVAFGSDGRCVDAAVAVGAAGPTPFLVPEAAAALRSSSCDGEAASAAAEAVVAAAEPIDDVRGTRRHRLRVLRSLARRVIETAAARAREAGER